MPSSPERPPRSQPPRARAGLFARFRSDERGLFITITAVLAPLLLMLTGVAIDYSRVETARRMVQHAGDTAALAIAQAQLLGDEGASGRAEPFVLANMGELDGLTVNGVSVEEFSRGHALVTIEAEMRSLMLGFFGVTEFDLTIVSEARFDNPADVDFTVLMDRSPSMLLGATLEDMDAIGELNRSNRHGSGCGFACHYEPNDTYTESRDEGIVTRLDAAKDAVIRSFQVGVSKSDENQGEIYAHVFTFTTGLEAVDDGTLAEVVNRGRIADIDPDRKNEVSGNIYRQTDIHRSIRQLEEELQVQRRRHPERLPFVLLLTDGVANYGARGRVIEPIDPVECDRLKNLGAVVSVIYTTYFPLPGNGTYRRYVQSFEDDIAPRLEQCATPGWFFEAQFAEDIEAAVGEILTMAMPRPQLTR